MKSILDEILSESTVLNERPYSRTQGAIDNAKGRVKGAFGSGQVEQGAANTGKYANALWKQFKTYLGQVYGSAPDLVSYDDVESFFEANGLPTSALGQNTGRKFSPKDVGEMLLVAARDYARHPATQGQRDRQAAKQNQQNNTSQNAGQDAGQSKPAPEQSPAPAPQDEPAASDDTASTEAPAAGSSLQTVLQDLSPEQREALLKLIS